MTQYSSEFAGVDLVGATATFYTDPSDVRFELSLDNAERWRDSGRPLVVVDGSPEDGGMGDWVAAAHRRRGAIVLPSDVNGIATQRKQGIAYAVAGAAENMVTHEPEKTHISDFASEIIQGLTTYDVLVVGRTALAESTMPPVQRRTERLAGWVLEQTHAFPADALCGPRGFTVAGAEHLARYPANEANMNNWIYMYHTPLAAREAGLPIGGVSFDLRYPQAMVAQETGSPVFDRKRYDQFKLQLDYLLGRSDVRPESRRIADFVLNTIAPFDADASNEVFEDHLVQMEAEFSPLGYHPRPGQCRIGY
jgi:hypothetical protein